MRHDDRRFGDGKHPGILADREFLTREDFHRIAFGPPIAVAHTRKIDGGDVEIARQERRNETPPIGMRGIAVNQQQPRPRRIAPAQIVDARPFHFDEATFRRNRDGLAEPLGRRRRRAGQRRQRRFQIGKIDLVGDGHGRKRV